ncbi:hypothetical protein ABZZ79_30240 [Streptomyces sp. NPDC006458]|uniref:hypothetical protein n=1 Tax=Streptomyces sp. NPDC006458 TaxID=3154302 RepID=UPI00339E1728
MRARVTAEAGRGPLRLALFEEYVVTTLDVGGGQYLSDGTGVFRLWRLDWI